ncbi:FkbM family methyltransferase, partial [Actinoplanes sp. NPDC048791]|uniref:FkbM family methyltransferase n=1 Tax=Actinoplanes sp. NPDC048791 TaxID=3154623 RepID=UPI0033D46065
RGIRCHRTARAQPPSADPAGTTGLRNFEVRPQVHFVAPSEKELHWQYAEIFEQGGYADIVLPERATVVDVGANIGLFAVFVKGLFPDARIQAFEPMPEAAAALRDNISLHRLTGIEVEQRALGAIREESVEFTYYPVLPGNSTRYPDEKELQKEVLSREEPVEDVERQHTGYPVRVAVERLSSYLKPEQNIDLLKIDVEGAELEVLRGIDDRHWPLVRQAVLEVQDLNGRLRAVCELLQSHGMRSHVRPSPMIPADIRTFMVHATR